MALERLTKKQVRLRNQQESKLLSVIQEFEQNGKHREALLLIKQSRVSFPQHLIALINIGFKEELREEVLTLFSERVKGIDSIVSLMSVLGFVRSPKRSFLGPIYGPILEKRIQELDASWDGTLLSHYTGHGGNTAPKPKTLSPEEISDPEMCLTAATQVEANRRGAFLERYIALGGSPRDERFLKFQLNRILLGKGRDKTERFLRLVPQLAEVMHPGAFRAWMRRNTGDYVTIRGDVVSINPRFARNTLALYIKNAPELTPEDWAYIAERAVALKDETLQRICFDQLKSLPRNSSGQTAFDALVQKFAKGVEPKELGSLVNRIYAELPVRVPVNKSAALAVSRWADAVLVSNA